MVPLATSTAGLAIRRTGFFAALVGILGNLRRYDGNCNENVTLKLNFALSSLLRLLHVDQLYEIGELHVRLLGTNGFHVKAKSGRSTAASLRCRKNLKYENFTSSFGRLR